MDLTFNHLGSRHIMSTAAVTTVAAAAAVVVPGMEPLTPQ